MPLMVKPRTITLSGQWFVSIQTEREVEPPIPVSTTAIGIDVGIARFATMSDGSFVAPLNTSRTCPACGHVSKVPNPAFPPCAAILIRSLEAMKWNLGYGLWIKHWRGLPGR